MNKLKVGDKVLIKCSENNTLLEEVFVEDKILFEITSVYYNDTKKMWAYKIRDLKNIFVFDYVEDELELYKTPHQELLDLGYTLICESDIYVNYTKVIDTKAIHLTFDKLLRRYKTWITYTPTGDKVPVFVSKTEAELFARYLDYMVNWREYVKEELENGKV